MFSTVTLEATMGKERSLQERNSRRRRPAPTGKRAGAVRRPSPLLASGLLRSWCQAPPGRGAQEAESQDGLLDLMLPLEQCRRDYAASDRSGSTHASPAVSDWSCDASQDGLSAGDESGGVGSIAVMRTPQRPPRRTPQGAFGRLQNEARSLPLPLRSAGIAGETPRATYEHKAHEMYERIRGSSFGGSLNLGRSPAEDGATDGPTVALDALVLGQDAADKSPEDLIFDLDL